MALSLLWCTMAIALPKCNGQDTSKWTMCQGTKSRDDGVIYVGEWKYGLRHGKGIGTHPYAGNYVGEYKDDKQNGYKQNICYLDYYHKNKINLFWNNHLIIKFCFLLKMKNMPVGYSSI